MQTDKRATWHEFFNTLTKSSLENYSSQTACGRFLQNALQIIFFSFVSFKLTCKTFVRGENAALIVELRIELLSLSKDIKLSSAKSLN